MTDDRRRWSPASPARTAATSPSDCSPRVRRCTGWSASAADAAPTQAGRSRLDAARRRPDRRVDSVAGWSPRSSPTRSTTWPASRRSRSPGRNRSRPARSPGWPRPACCRPPGSSSDRPAGRCGSCRRPAPRSSATRAGAAGRDDPDRAGHPVRRRQGLRPPHGAASTAAVACTRRRLILYNHESPRRPDDVRHPQDHPRGGPDRARRAGRAARWATWTPAATGAGRRTTSTRWSGLPGHDEPGDYVVATGVAHSVREFVAAAFAAGRCRGLAAPRPVDPAFVRPVDAVELVGDRVWRATDWAGRRTVGFDEIVRRMVSVDLG